MTTIRIYADPAHADSQRFMSELRESWEDLSLPLEQLTLELWEPSGGVDSDAAEVAVHVHFQSNNANEAIARALEHDRPVFPVVPNAELAGELPSLFSPINAFLQARFGERWCDALVAEVLAHVVFPRRRAQVFISYRRIDADAVAGQLHDAFTKRGYHVFLDTASVAPSEDFQHEIMWRLNDTDLVVLLMSPRLEQSQWVKDEVEFAQSSNIGIALVRWPDACFAEGEGPSWLTRRLLNPRAEVPLELDDLRFGELVGPLDERYAEGKRVDDALTDAACERVLAEATKHRAVALRGRQIDLLGEVFDREERREHNPVHLKQPGDLRVTRGDRALLLRVFPYRPDLLQLHETALAGNQRGLSTVAIYRENLPRDRRSEATRWAGTRERFEIDTLDGEASE